MLFVLKNRRDGRQLASCSAKSKAMKLAQLMSWDKEITIFQGEKRIAQFAYGKDSDKLEGSFHTANTTPNPCGSDPAK